MAAKDIEAGRAHVLIALRDRMSAGLKRVEQNFGRWGRSFATAGAALTGASAGFLSLPIKLGAASEQMRVSLEVMLGSADAAKSMLESLSEFATSTPFGIDELSKNAQLLLNYGVAADQIIPNLRAIGDVAAGDSEKFARLALAFGQVQAKGRLMGGEVMQMVEAGFNPLQEISRTTGRSVAELQEAMAKGQISAQMLTAAFASASGPGGKFHGMMEKQSKTANGLLSTLMDVISNGIRPIGEAAITVLKPLMEFGISAGQAFAAFLTTNRTVASAIAVTTLGVGALGVALVGVGGALFTVSAAASVLASIGSTVAAIVGAVASPIAIAIAAVLTLEAAVVGALIYVASQAGLVSEAFGWLKTVFNSLAATATKTMNGIMAALSAGQYRLAAQILWAGLKVGFLQGADKVLEAFQYLWNNATRLQVRFFAKLLEIGYAIGKRLPSVIAAGFTGGNLAAIIGRAIAEVTSDDFNLGSVLDNRIAEAQRDLGQLTHRARGIQRARSQPQRPPQAPRARRQTSAVSRRSPPRRPPQRAQPVRVTRAPVDPAVARAMEARRRAIEARMRYAQAVKNSQNPANRPPQVGRLGTQIRQAAPAVNAVVRPVAVQPKPPAPAQFPLPVRAIVATEKNTRDLVREVRSRSYPVVGR